jgi:addiction module RelB/DinJ family antitoxin
MQSTQINLKIDPKLKKKSEIIAKKLGFSLSGILRAFLADLTRKQQINFSLNKPKKGSADLERELISAGFSEKSANEHARAYEELLVAEKNNLLTHW